MTISSFRLRAAIVLCAAVAGCLIAGQSVSAADSVPWSMSDAAQVGGPPSGEACPNCPNVNMPCASEACGYEVIGSLLYLQPGAGNLEYATLVNPLPAPSPHWVNSTLSPDLTPAFEFGLRSFCECGNDCEVTWTHLESSAHDSLRADPLQFVGPSYEIGPDANVFQRAQGSVDFGYDAVNLDAGHQMNVGGCVQVRLFGGLQYARIREKLEASFASDDDQTTSSNTTDSLFNGVGPRIGVRAQRGSGGFQILGELAGAALVGTMESRIDFTATSPSQSGLSVPPNNPQSLTSPNATQVVPALDTKLGASYALPCGRCGLFKIEGGYQAAVYVNAVNEYSLTEVVTPTNTQSVGVFLRTAEHLQSDFTVHGPYLTASWLF